MGDDNSEHAETAKLPARTAAQRLKHVQHLALPDIDEMRTRVAQLAERVHGKLEGLPPARLVDPPATIAAPAAFHYALLGDAPEVSELREMFENLLASSMDRDTAGSAHPAFVSMISQLTPDEARILKSIDRDEYPLDLVHEDGAGSLGPVVGSRTQLGLGIGIDETRQEQYLSNLDRLGILRSGASLDPDVRNALATALRTAIPGRDFLPSGQAVKVTPFGRQFLDACVRARVRRGAE
jgi:hypothetical protein